MTKGTVFLATLVLVSGILFCDLGVAATQELYAGGSEFAGETISYIGEDGPLYRYHVEKWIPIFEKRTGIKVNAEIVPAEQLDVKLVTEFLAETGAYNIFTWGPHQYGEFATKGWIEPLAKYFKEDLAPKGYGIEQFLPNIVNTIMCMNGEIYGLPISVDVKLLAYRTDLFSEAGLTPPETFSQEIRYARKLTNPPTYGVAIHGKQYDATVWVFYTFLWGCGGEIYDENWNPTFQQEPGVKALTAYCDLIEYGPPDILTYDFMKVESCFASGRAAMAHIWPGSCGSFVNPETSKVIGKWDAAQIPHWEGCVSHPGGGGTVYTISSQASPREKKAAFQLGAFLSSEEVDLDSVLAMKNASPCCAATFQNSRVKEMHLHFPAMFEALKTFRMPRSIAPQREINSVVVLAMQQAAIGEKSPRQALADAAKKVRKILEEAAVLK